MKFGLEEEVLKVICDCFKTIQEIEKVKIFGSRAKGNYKSGSDIDLALYGNIDFANLIKISSKLEDLPTPYKFDVLVYDNIENEALKEHIDRAGTEFYLREGR